MTSAAWIILTGALVGASCAVVGCFLVLRRLAMLGDAISHAVLPGIILALILTQSLASLPVFLGAVALGLLTAVSVQALSQSGVQGDAAIGVTFTALFALGVAMIKLVPGLEDVHIDTECVLYGEIAYTPWETLSLGAWELRPRAVWINGGLLLLNVAVIGLLFKQFKVCSFDPQLAAAMGINVTLMHYLLMGLLSVTIVGAFESVGVILVVAMLVAPAAAAYLLTERLERMLLVAVGIGILSSFAGYFLARHLGASIAGAMATVSGGCFALAFLLGPRHGLLSRWLAHRRLRARVGEEDALLWVARQREQDPAFVFTARELAAALERLPLEAAALARRLARAGLLAEKEVSGDRLQVAGRPQGREASFVLTEAGQERAVALLRRHRLYETYLGELGYPADHVHHPADRAEHHVSPELTAALDEATRSPERDPQGKPIPPSG